MNLFRLLLCCLSSCLFVNATNKEKIEPGLLALVEQIDAKNATIQNLRSYFVQRKEISLMTEPVEMKGRFYLEKTSGMRFDFEKENDLSLLITETEMISIAPMAKKASRIKLKKRRSDLMQRLLIDNLKTLLNYFTVSRQETPRAVGEKHLILTPNKRKLKKKFRALHLWVNSDHLIHHVKVILKDGDIYELFLFDIETNVQLNADHFKIGIPEDFKMSDRMEFIFGTGATF